MLHDYRSTASRRLDTLYGLAVPAIFVGSVLVLGAACYVVTHFVIKFW